MHRIATIRFFAFVRPQCEVVYPFTYRPSKKQNKKTTPVICFTLRDQLRFYCRGKFFTAYPHRSDGFQCSKDPKYPTMVLCRHRVRLKVHHSNASLPTSREQCFTWGPTKSSRCGPTLHYQKSVDYTC